jgi:hypothetical protein
MEPYKNLGGDSDVFGYEIGSDSITVEFRDGAVYVYNYQSTGSTDVEQMKALAVAGQGLNGFISRVVGKRYAVKLK